MDLDFYKSGKKSKVNYSLYTNENISIIKFIILEMFINEDSI